MGQRAPRASLGKIFRAPRHAEGVVRGFLLALLTALSVISCDRATPTTSPSSADSRPAQPTAASLVPTATDLILGINAGSHLVAVSNWDATRPQIAGLPRVGDYRSIDWERLTQLRPALLIVQFRPDKMPPGLEDRANALGIKLINIKNNSLEDLFTTLDRLGDALSERAKSDAASAALKKQLDTVRARVAGRSSVRTLITRSESSRLACVGGGNYLDDVLAIAGGANVLQGGDNSYPEIDRERLLTLNPDVVIVLLPGAPPQVVKQAEDFWRSVPQVEAVKTHRVNILTDSYVLLGSLSLGKVAEQFADILHPSTSAPRPTTIGRP